VPGPARRVHINLENPHLGLVRHRFDAAGWQLTDGAEWDLWWGSGEPANEAVLGRSAGTLVSQLRGSACLTRKDGLWRTVEGQRARLLARGVDVPPVVPETFLMPSERDAFLAAAQADPGARWIQKPRAGARGEGVSVLTDPEAAETGREWLVQRYVDPPHLLDGRKYTVRCYVVVTTLEPLRAVLFQDGLVKRATLLYEEASATDPLAHLTNPQIQRSNPDFSAGTFTTGLADYSAALRADGVDPAPLFAAMADLLAFPVAAARETLSRMNWADGAVPGGLFQLLGCDVTVDADLRPWLLEVNLGPSLSVEAANPEAGKEEWMVKARLVDGIIGLLSPDADPEALGFATLFPDERRSAWLTLPRPSERAAPPDAAEIAPRPEITVQQSADGLVLRHPAAGTSLGLDAAGAYVWSALSEGLAPDQITAELASAFPDLAWRVGHDVWNALGTWIEAGLLGPAEPRRRPTS